MEPPHAAEQWIVNAVLWLKLGVETTGAMVIGLGTVIALGKFFRATLVERRATDFNAIRLVLARYLALALEFQLGADILATAIAPGWQEIGRLGAIAVIRTGLNYFLSLEMRHERAAGKSGQAVQTESERPGKMEPAVPA